MLRTIRALVLLPCLFLTQGQLISQSRSTVLYNTNSGKIAAPLSFFPSNVTAGTNITISTNGDGGITVTMPSAYIAHNVTANRIAVFNAGKELTNGAFRFDTTNVTAAQVLKFHSATVVTNGLDESDGTAYRWVLHEEFMLDINNGAVPPRAGSIASGGANGNCGFNIPGRPGISEYRLSTGAGDRSGYRWGTVETITASNGAISVWGSVRLLTTNDPPGINNTNFAFRVGFGDASAAEPTDGIYIEASTNSPFWQLKCSNNSARVATNSTTLVSTNWTAFRFDIDANGSQVIGYFGDTFATMTPQGTNTANIPVSRAFAPLIQMIRVGGANIACTAQVDVVRWEGDITLAR